MKLFYSFLLILSFLGLTSCIEIIDDISLKNDGSGTLKYTINLSSSKVKINSILALDSLDGRKVPSIPEMEERIVSFKKKLSTKTGISNVTIESDFTNYIFKLQCDFTSVIALQNALKDVIEEESKEKNIPELDHNWLSWDGTKMTRSIPEITVKRTKVRRYRIDEARKLYIHYTIRASCREIRQFSSSFIEK